MTDRIINNNWITKCILGYLIKITVDTRYCSKEKKWVFLQTQLKCKCSASGNQIGDEMNDQYATMPDDHYYEEQTRQRVTITRNVSINSHVKTGVTLRQCLLR